MRVADVVVVWRVSSHCNFNCAFCGFARALSWPRMHLAWPKAEQVLDALANITRPRAQRVLISWLGGEPLLWPHLEQACARAQALGFGLALTTNGSLFGQPRMLAWCANTLDEITLSADGLPAIHDALRDAPGSWAALAHACAGLRMRNPQLRIRINTILMRGNIAQFERLCDAVATWGVDTLSFNVLGGNDRPEFYAENSVLPEQWHTFACALPALRARFAARNLNITGSEAYLQRIAASCNGTAIAVADCAPGQHFIFVDEHGRAAPCSYTSGEYGLASNELAPNLAARWAHMRSTRRAKACDDCLCTNVFGKFEAA